MKRMAVGVAAAAAFWPVWHWYLLRITDGSDEPWGVLALVTAAVLAVRREKGTTGRPPGQSRRPGQLAAVSAMVAVYALAFGFLPPLLRAVLAMSAIAVLLAGSPGGGLPGLWALLLLSLPLVPTAQFFLGYPLRLLAAESTTAVLNLAGLAVAREGIALRWAGETVLVDAPCSGVKMMWAGLYLAATLAAHRGVRLLPAVALFAAALGVTLLANIARSTLLFFKEAHLVALPGWTHAATGLVAFAVAMVVILKIAPRFGRPRSLFLPLPFLMKPSHRFFFGLCLLAAAAPFFHRPAPSSPGEGRGAALPPWPSEIEGRPLAPLPLDPAEARFASGFPGRIGKFTDGEREYILRWIGSPTRKLHSSADCMRGAGFAVTPQPVLREASGVQWNRFFAGRGGRRFAVRERISDAAGAEWTDISTWYWSAVLQRTRPPWFAITVVEADR